jgi:predicted acetyltransferase
VLFTGQPEIYERHGFVRVAQQYTECRLDEWPRQTCGQGQNWLDRPAVEEWEAIATIYADDYPRYDGKLLRDACYWTLYQTLFRLNPHCQLVLCGAEGRWLGYARCEAEPRRLLVSEFCCQPKREDIADALISAIGEEADRLGRTFVSWALPIGHFLDRLLESRGITQTAEGTDAGREVFMIRPAVGEPLGPFAQLSWSLADKF